jgi:hypothetical protein
MNLMDWWSKDLWLELGLGVRVQLLVCLLERRLLPLLLLVKDVDCLPKIY